MQQEGKRNGVMSGGATGLDKNDADTVAGTVRELKEIIKDVEADIPFGAILRAYATPLESLVKQAGQRRDVNVLARLHGVISMLEAEGNTAEHKLFLVEQATEVEQMVLAWTSPPKSTAPGIISVQETKAQIDISPSHSYHCEELLRTLPAIDDRIVNILQERNLLNVERLLNTDALELARVTGISTNTAFEIKNLLRNDAEQRAHQDVARRVAELKTINEQLSAECDGLIAANNTLLSNNRNLKGQYPVISAQYDLEVKNFKELQSRVVSARIESNRLSTEINFLRDEHRKLLDLVEEKHLLLDDLFRRFNSIRASFEFVSGETGFAEDIVMNVEGLLNKALLQKKSLNDKIASSEESMEKLFSEFNSIVKKGKMEFYCNV